MSSVFLDLFTVQRYETMEAFTDVIGLKANGQPQSAEYVQGIVHTVEASAVSQGERGALFPFWHFNTRKAVEMWPKEVYRDAEMRPLTSDLKFGPLTGIKGPRTPVLVLKRAFGLDCFEVYFQSGSHTLVKKTKKEKKAAAAAGGGAEVVGTKSDGDTPTAEFPPLLQGGGAWQDATKMALHDEHYVPMQAIERRKRRPTLHGRERLFEYLAEQEQREEAWLCTKLGCALHLTAR